MAEKSAPGKVTIDDLLSVLEKQFGMPPPREREEDPILDQLMVAVLAQYMDQATAQETIRDLSDRFIDFNELRVSAVDELTPALGHVPAEQRDAVAYELRMALQDVYDGTHGLDLEPLRARTPSDQRKFLKHLARIGGGPAALIFQIALGDGQLAFGPLEEHLLQRFGLLPRSSSRDRQREAIERRVKSADRMRFTWLFGAGARLYEEDFDAKHPFCKLLVKAKAKELVVREQNRKREEARRQAEEKRLEREAEKQRKADERERLKQEREAEKVRKAAEARARKDEATRARETARKQAEAKKKADASKKKAAEVKQKAAAKKKVADAKKQAASAKKKAAAAKKAAASKKKAAAKKKTAAGKKKTSAGKKRPAAKKPAPKKKAGAKPKTAKKKAPKKSAKRTPVKKAAKKTAKGKPTKKAAKKKTTKKKTTKKPAKKKAAKKTAKRKPTKKAAKKKTRRR